MLLLQTQAETITMIALTIRIPVTDARTGTTILTRTFLMWWYSLFSSGDNKSSTLTLPIALAPFPLLSVKSV